MFERTKLLDIIRNFIVFEVGGKGLVKKLANYHQVRATNRALTHTKRATSTQEINELGSYGMLQVLEKV